MKLLLTSGGITNPSIAKALFDLVGKKPEDTSLVFIPTAFNVDIGDKTWFIEGLIELKNLNFKSIDIADISAAEEKIWRPKLETADIIFFGGGSNFHLMRWIVKSGLAQMMPEFLKTKIYVGLSAGSMVASKDMVLGMSQKLYEEDLDETENIAGLGLVDFYFLPHLDSQWFPKLREDFIRKTTAGISEKIYAMDDNSALKVIDGVVEVVSEGKWFVING